MGTLVSSMLPANLSGPSVRLRWHRELGIAMLVGLVPMAVATTFALTRDWFALAEDDALSSYQPLVTDALARLLSGELPLWSDHSGCGYPLLARTLAFYPGYWLAHVVCFVLRLPGHEVAVGHVLHLGLAAITAFLYLRYLRVGRLPATVSALGYGLMGPLLGMDTNWCEYATLVAYVPLAFVSIEKVVAGDRSWFWTCLAALLGSLVFLGTGLLGTFKFAFLFLLYFLARCKVDTFRQSAVRLTAAAVLGLIGALGFLLAQWEFLCQSERYVPEGVSAGEGLVALAVPPEFYRGFVYPLIEFDWPTGPTWCPRFIGGSLFVGPLAPLALFVAFVGFRHRPGPHRALLLLALLYFVLSLGYYWLGNLILVPLPLFSQHRWPVRWTVEFCALTALLTGLGLELAWQHPDRRRTRQCLVLFLVVVVAAVLVRTGLSTLWELQFQFIGLAWILAAALLVRCFWRGQRTAFYAVALVATVAAMVANVPGVQHHRFGVMTPMYQAPIELDTDKYGRVLFLAHCHEQLGRTEGCFGYNIAHAFGYRTVINYGPFRMKTQQWMVGVNGHAEIQDEGDTIHTFLQGHTLETLRVEYIVVPRANDRLNAACRANPDLRMERATTWYNVYRNEGFREPAFLVREARSESDLAAWSDMGAAPLKRLVYVTDEYTGPTSFDGNGRVRDFTESHGTIVMHADAATPQFLVVTDTWYPGWHATVDGAPVPIQRVNGSFMGVQVPAGEHEIVFRFRPEWLIFCVWLSLAMLAVLMTACAVGGLRRLARSLRQPAPA